MNKQKEKAGVGLSLGYGVGELGSQMAWYMINNYLMIFYTDVVSLSATAISLIMLICRVWDAVNDPMMGMICDRTHSRWGRFRPYILFATPFMAIFNILTFTVFPVQGTMKAVLCFLTYLIMGMLYTVVVTAYASLVNVLSLDSQVRQTLSAARNAFNSLGSIILGAVAMPMILHFSKSDVANAHGYQMTAIILSIVMIPLFLVTALVCKEKHGATLHASEAEQPRRSVVDSIKGLLKNDQLVLVVVSTLGGTIGVMGRMTMLSYYVIYVVGSFTMIAPVYTTIAVCGFIGSFFIPFFTKLLGKGKYMIVLNFLMLISFMTLYLASSVSIPLLMVCSAIAGFCNSSLGVSFGMVSDSIEYGDWKNGVREEGLACSFLTLSVKLAGAIVGVGGVQLLAHYGYVANAMQTEYAIHGINVAVNLVPSIFVFLFGVIPLLFYKLNNKKVAEIGEDLKRRAGVKE